MSSRTIKNLWVRKTKGTVRQPHPFLPEIANKSATAQYPRKQSEIISTINGEMNITRRLLANTRAISELKSQADLKGVKEPLKSQADLKLVEDLEGVSPQPINNLTQKEKR